MADLARIVSVANLVRTERLARVAEERDTSTNVVPLAADAEKSTRNAIVVVTCRTIWKK